MHPLLRRSTVCRNHLLELCRNHHSMLTIVCAHKYVTVILLIALTVNSPKKDIRRHSHLQGKLDYQNYRFTSVITYFTRRKEINLLNTMIKEKSEPIGSKIPKKNIIH